MATTDANPPPASPAPLAHQATKPPFIVGIGASAGGLEALEEFLAKLPVPCGLAFIVVQHLDPNHKGMLPELLQRVTKLRVMQANNHMAVEPNYTSKTF